MAIVTSASVLPNQKKQCCKIAQFTDTPCIFRSVITGMFHIIVVLLTFVTLSGMFIVLVSNL
jgi:hypothetical protein